FRPRRGLEREEPVGQTPIPAYVRKPVARAGPRVVEQLGPLDRVRGGAGAQRPPGQRPPFPFRYEPDAVDALPAGRRRRDEGRREEGLEAVAPGEQPREQSLLVGQPSARQEALVLEVERRPVAEQQGDLFFR